MRRFKLRFVSLLLLCIMAFTATIPVFADNYSEDGAMVTVRIAFYPLDGFFEYDDDGNECGYGVDYLNELKKYENINWEYVYADSWEGIKQMMLDGKVDVRMPVSEPTKPSETYDYTIEPMMVSYHAIMTLNSRSDLYYHDYKEISQLKIAATSSLLDKTGVGDYLDSIGVLDNIIYYDDYNLCRDALEAGEVDALISNVMDLTDDMKILDKFSVVDNYITTLKGNDCYHIINSAMTKLKLQNPSFQTTLYEKYYPERASEPFTKEECEYIAKTDKLTVAVYTDRKPVSYCDTDGSFKGIAIELADKISDKIGIPFEYVPVTTKTQFEMLDSADLVMPVPQTTDLSDCFISSSILDLEILMAVKNGNDEPLEGEKMGVLSTTPGILATMKQLDMFEIVEYGSNREALNALQLGKISAFANSSYVINWMLENPRYNDLSALRYKSFPLEYKIAGKKSDTVLQSILNKAISTISEDEKDAIIQSGTKLSMDDFTFEDRLYMYWHLILAAVLIFVGLVLFALMYNNSRNKYIKQIEESSKKQQEASKAKSEFLSRMSHDMRTPLNVIMGMSSLAQDNKNPDDTNDCLHKINISGEFLLGLINDVLDMEHIESGKITLHPVPYSGEEFSQYVSAVIKPLCMQKNINFVYTYSGPNDFVVMQDKLRINQVYFNLLSNAVKFTPEGGKIVFHTDFSKTDHDTVVMDVTIADTGIGMKPEFVKHMFEAFSQENQEYKPVSEGTGLGLFIVKQICDLMGMTISVKSDPGVGTVFTLHGEYDIAKEPVLPDADVKKAPVNDNSLKNKAILVCEDHPLNQEIIRRLLEKKGAIAVIADNGKRGLDIFERSVPNNFAAVLMDIRMPVMDGFEATKAIRSMQRTDAKTIPIIALTANAYEEDIKKCLDAGMNAHLAKPIDSAKLYAALEELTNDKENI